MLTLEKEKVQRSQLSAHRRRNNKIRAEIAEIEDRKIESQ